MDDLILELDGIRNALGQEDSEPWRRPRPRALTEAPSPERFSGEPRFDSGDWDIIDPDLWEEQKESTRRAVEGEGLTSRSGIEALVWYISFHDNQRGWVIYIPLSSLALIDDLYLRKLRMERGPTQKRD